MWDGFGDHVYSLTDEVMPFDEHPGEYQILSFRVEPGDALLFNYRTVHRSRENRGRERRVALSWRWLGDDVHWAWCRGREPVIDPSDTYLQPGDRITDDNAFPVVYTAA
jgi:ectoine hydroxylase-related dioxygenase (phytanoyl-CoA dioxygenase family)